MNMKPKIFIDAGHGGSDTGAVNGNLIERDINLVMAVEVEKVLISYGARTMMSRRTNDKAVSISDRTKMANVWGADLFFSLHNNGGGGDGSEAIHSIHSEKGNELGQFVCDYIKEAIGQNVRRVFERESEKRKGTDYFGVLRLTDMLSLIFEGFFLDNLKDREIADTVEEQKLFGRAIGMALVEFFGLDKEQQEKPLRWDEQMGVDAIDSLASIFEGNKDLQDLLSNPEDWKQKLLAGEPIPAWLFWHMHRRMAESILALQESNNA